MDRNNWREIAYWIMIAFVIGMCIYVYVYLSGNAKSCLDNPITYYQAKMNETCICTQTLKYDIGK
jgi:hypothetical protein